MVDAAAPAPQDALLPILRETILAEVRTGQDLTLRHVAIVLTVYLTDEPQTVRGLAKDLGASKPAITRGLDRLGELDLVRRKRDPMDLRSVIAQRTPAGAAMMQRLKARMAAAAAAEADLRKAS
jgi:DNA-binding MarR family transcriptional regulator